METIFLIGIGIFSVSALYFLATHKITFNTAFLVSLVTIASYLVMYEGTFVTAESTTSEAVYYTRWLFYALSCSLLMYEIGRSLKLDKGSIATLIYLIVVVMITGALAAVYEGTAMLSMFVVSSVAYAALLYKIFAAKSKNKAFVLKYILVGWTTFPVVFLFAPEGYALITASTAATLYLLLDVFTKIIFYIEGDSAKHGTLARTN